MDASLRSHKWRSEWSGRRRQTAPHASGSGLIHVVQGGEVFLGGCHGCRRQALAREQRHAILKLFVLNLRRRAAHIAAQP